MQATSTDLTQALKDRGGTSWTHRRFSLRNILIVTQVAVSLTLLVVLGLLSIGIQASLGIQSGFNPPTTCTSLASSVRDGYSGTRAAAFLEKLLDRVKAFRSYGCGAHRNRAGFDAGHRSNGLDGLGRKTNGVSRL